LPGKTQKTSHLPTSLSALRTIWLRVFAACANFPINETSRNRIFLPPRREERQVRIDVVFFFAAFASLRLCSGHALREIFRFSWSRLSRARSFVVMTPLAQRLFLSSQFAPSLSATARSARITAFSR
jgi:hypothetical protein